MLILGGGFIAAEMAHIFGSFGVDVAIVTRGTALISHHDADVSHALTRIYAERFETHLGVTATAARATFDGGVALDLSDGSTVDGDLLLVATGRTPNSDQLDVAAAGIDVHDDGRIVTDEHLATSAPGVVALGDISAPHMLKHVANHEARVVQHNLLFPDDPIAIEEGVVPHVVFGDPQVAAVGLTEAEARAEAVVRGGRIGVGMRRYADTAAGWALEDTTSFCKVVADLDTRLVLGAHIIGPWASVLLQPLVTGMSFDLTIDELARGQMYPHPALTEVVEQALLEL
jgi:mycothione reductase